MQINREIQNRIQEDFFKGRVVIVTGPRQVGKTTLVNQILSKEDPGEILKFNADNPSDRESLNNKDLTQLKALIGKRKIIFIDEAQKVPTIGNTLKLLVDEYKDEKQILATGSSSLNLLTNTAEPLTGRKFVHELFGLSVREIEPEGNVLRLKKQLEDILIYGTYPEIYLQSTDQKRRLLTELTQSYLYQDILTLEQVRNPEVLHKLLSAIALQVGSEVSYKELANLVGLDVKTIQRYVDLLEKNYVLFRLSPYFSNKRKTLSKQHKLYFYDLGVRNTLINNFNSMDLRNDAGALWENFLILERMKLQKYQGTYMNYFFWRTYAGAEVDLVEQSGSKLQGYEFKWGNKKREAPKGWMEQEGTSYSVVNKESFAEFLGL